MDEIRILVVDDSVVVRTLIGSIVGRTEGMLLAGHAANGRRALEMLDEVNPDLVTLDVEMPELDGLATLREIRRRRPRLPVIMFSTFTSRGAATAIEALSLGANDYLCKPEGAGSLQENLSRLEKDLIPRIRALVSRRRAAVLPESRGEAARSPAAPRLPAATSSPPPRPRAVAPLRLEPSGRRLAHPPELLVIGVSTGGPNALARLMPELPASLPVPVLIVQHMPPLFTRMLAERLDLTCQLTVREAENGAVLRAGEAWVARGDWHLEVEREQGRLLLREHQDAPVNSCRPAVDLLFLSAAAACGGGLVGVVLTGMGRDGLRGSRAIRQAGGLVVAQDEESSVVWGMPGAVAAAGLADAVLPLDRVAAHLLTSLSAAPAARRVAPCR